MLSLAVRLYHLKITDTSINGTWINDVRMTAGSSKRLKNGDIIRIAASIIQVVDSQYASANKDDTWATDMRVVSSTEIVVTNLVADIRKFLPWANYRRLPLAHLAGYPESDPPHHHR